METVYLFDYDATDGTARNRRVWLSPGHAPGRPDGAAVDADGCYWSARWGGSAVVRFTPSGRIDRVIEMPASQVAMCAFGSPSLCDLYVPRRGSGSDSLRSKWSHAGGIFVIPSVGQGLKEKRFGG
ncbi:SMP-30/gluconolactonase/LRE family protein [Bosea sp. CCNWLY174]|uniref:SMP-30/gluconolactonase/LRE family protein n=1 Tax=unclassified Bosea (in: a-proteobacteria) TaxID=2653178 RepID=UPI003FA5FA7B